MEIEQALKWADTWGQVPSNPPRGDALALTSLAAEVRRLRECWNDAQKCAATAADSERLEWLMRNVSGKEFRRLGVTYGGNCGRDRIDAAMKPHNAEVSGRAA